MRLAPSLLSAAVFFAAAASAGDIVLPPPPKSGGPGLFAALDARASAGQQDFPSAKPGADDLSAILWAASGRNRDGSKWTVPMAMGKEPYCKIYAALDEGVFLYDWRNHLLRQVSADNVKADIPAQSFVKNAPAALYIVTDGEALAAIGDPVWAGEFGPLLAGAMSQDIYLACGAVGVATRVVYSIDRAEAARLLGLGPKDAALFVMPLGKR